MTETGMPRSRLLKLIAIRFGLGFLVLAAMFCISAGTVRYWEAWVWMAVLIIPMLGLLAYLWKNDRALLERRMRTREKEKQQSLVIKLSWIWFVIAFLMPGLDKRFGWSDVPAQVVIAADVLVLLGYSMLIMVLRENSYASRVVEVEKGQKVVDTGPYAVVRHPFYLGSIILYVASPLALGSYWALLPMLMIIPMLTFMRIPNEEQVLRRELPGYEEYMQRVKYRVLPGVW